MTLRLIIGTTALMTLLVGSGCDPCAGSICGACPNAIMLNVVDEVTGDPVTGVTVSDPTAYCNESPGFTTCNIGTVPGQYGFTVDASGYAPAHLTYDVPADPDGGCCSCGYEYVSDTLSLTPLTP